MLATAQKSQNVKAILDEFTAATKGASPEVRGQISGWISIAGVAFIQFGDTP